VRDEIVGFAKELACPRLRAQVQRLLESVGATETPNDAVPKAVPVAVPPAVSPQLVTPPPAPAQEALDPAAACSRDEQRAREAVIHRSS
jgi:hypothetical protein